MIFFRFIKTVKSEKIDILQENLLLLVHMYFNKTICRKIIDLYVLDKALFKKANTARVINKIKL